MVPGKDSLRVRFAGASELRVLASRGTYDLPWASARRAFDLRCSEAPHFCVRIPGTGVARQLGRESPFAEATAIQHGNMEPRRASLFRDRRCERGGHP